MSRKLVLLNVALIAAAVWTGARARHNWMEARKRVPVILAERVKPVAVPFTPAPAVPPLKAVEYAAIAEQTLFSADRNPTVVVEVAPPKPMPPLPVAHGVMDLGDGPVVMLSPKPGERQKEYKAGESIGAFKVLSVSTQEIVFEWDGKRVPKRLEELIQKAAAGGPAGAGGAPAAQRGAAAMMPAAVAAAPAASVSAPPAAAPGIDVGGGMRACAPGDSSPAGTVADGMKKVITDSPFGKICRWEPVR